MNCSKCNQRILATDIFMGHETATWHSVCPLQENKELSNQLGWLIHAAMLGDTKSVDRHKASIIKWHETEVARSNQESRQ